MADFPSVLQKTKVIKTVNNKTQMLVIAMSLSAEVRRYQNTIQALLSVDGTKRLAR